MFFGSHAPSAGERSCSGIVLVFLCAAVSLRAPSLSRRKRLNRPRRGRKRRFILPADQRPASWTLVQGRRLGAIFDRQGDGLQLVSLFDLAKHRQLLAAKPTPLFTVTMRQMASKEEVSLRADAGWEQVQAAAATPLELCWQTPKDKRLGGLRVTVLGSLDEAAGAMRWKLSRRPRGETVVRPPRRVSAACPGCRRARSSSSSIRRARGK